MASASQTRATALLGRASIGNEPAAAELFPLIYDELRILARNLCAKLPRGAAVQPTAVVNEAYLKLVDQTRVGRNEKSHFYAYAARTLRSVLVDEARRDGAAKRGGRQPALLVDETAVVSPGLNIDVIDLDEALTEYASLDPRASKIVELRFFSGLTVKETAQILGVSESTVRDDWKAARVWLRCRLQPGD